VTDGLEFAAIRGTGFEPVGQVLGAAVYSSGTAGTNSCPGSFGPQVQAMYEARRAAIERMAAECAELGGHGVVGVRLACGEFLLGGLEFTALGTAVRAPDAARGRRMPFTSGLSGQDFAKLIMAGWVPVGLALGASIRSRHDDRTTTRQARWGSGNAEVCAWTELVNQTRHDARRALDGDVKRLAAEGVVIATMQMRVHARDCPVAVGRRDHVVEATLIGTAIVRFSRASRAGGPVLAVMSLDARRPQAAGEGRLSLA
jgi:uncharacterized protein YbjQ (UPF0145 family)